MDLKKLFEENETKKASEHELLVEKFMDMMFEKSVDKSYVYGVTERDYDLKLEKEKSEEIINGLVENGFYYFKVNDTFFRHAPVFQKVPGLNHGKYSVRLANDSSEFLKIAGLALQRFLKKNEIENELYLAINDSFVRDYGFWSVLLSFSDEGEFKKSSNSNWSEGWSFGGSNKVAVSQEKCEVIKI